MRTISQTIQRRSLPSWLGLPRKQTPYVLPEMGWHRRPNRFRIIQKPSDNRPRGPSSAEKRSTPKLLAFSLLGARRHSQTRPSPDTGFSIAMPKGPQRCRKKADPQTVGLQPHGRRAALGDKAKPRYRPLGIVTNGFHAYICSRVFESAHRRRTHSSITDDTAD